MRIACCVIGALCIMPSFSSFVAADVRVSMQAQAEWNQTPGDHSAVRMDLAPDLGPHGAWYQWALTLLGYRTDVLNCGSTATDNPAILVEDVVGALSRGYGNLLLHSHGGRCPFDESQGMIGVVPYKTSSARHTKLTWYYGNGWPDTHLVPFDVTNSSGTTYWIALTTYGIAAHYTNRGSVLILDGCNTDYLVQGFAAGYTTALSYGFEVTSGVALNDLNTLSKNMAGWNGFDIRTLGQAWYQTTYSTPRGATNVVWAPTVNVFANFGPSGFVADVEAYAEFDCRMNDMVPASDILDVTGSVEILNPYWDGDNVVRFTLRGKYAGPGSVVVNSDTTTRYCCGARSYPADIPLDGNGEGPPGGDPQSGYAPNGDPDESTTYFRCGNPGATIVSNTAVRVQGGTDIEWRVENESDVEKWLVYWAADPSGPFTLAFEQPATGGPNYSWFDQGRTTGYYWLRDAETNGDTLSYEVIDVVDPFTPEADVLVTLDVDSLLTAMMVERAPVTFSPEQIPERTVMVIIVPDSLEDVVWPLAARHGEDGQFTEVVKLSMAGGMTGLTAYLRTRAMQGVKYVLFAGGSKPTVKWNNLLSWAPNRPGWDWSGSASYVGSPQQNIFDLPLKDDPAEEQQYSQSWWASWWMLYQKLVDFDGDGAPEMRLGVLPAYNRAELTLMVAKQIAAINQVKTGYPMNMVTLSNYALDNGRNRGDQALIWADSLAAYLPPSLVVQRLTATAYAYTTYASREPLSIAAFNEGRGAWIGNGTFGNRSRNGWIDAVNPGVGGTPWSWSKTNVTTHFPFYWGFLCGQTDDWRFYDPTYMAGFLKKAMMDLNHGFWGGFGPNCGSFLKAGFLIGKHSFLHAYSSGAESVGDAAFLGLRDVAFLYPEWKDVVSSYVFFGDPLIQVPYQEYRIVGVDNDMAPRMIQMSSSPNPTRGRTTIRFSLPTRSLVSFAVHDVQGRLIKAIPSASFDPGYHAMQWDGTGQDGNPVSSGVCYVRMDVAGKRFVQKVIMIR